MILHKVFRSKNAKKVLINVRRYKHFINTRKKLYVSIIQIKNKAVKEKIMTNIDYIERTIFTIKDQNDKYVYKDSIHWDRYLKQYRYLNFDSLAEGFPLCIKKKDAENHVTYLNEIKEKAGFSHLKFRAVKEWV